jgi:hypothetical protein
MSKIRVGIDIGSDGAIAIFKDDALIEYGKLPLVADELDMKGMVDMILRHIDDATKSVHVLMEDLASIFGTSASSNFQFGFNNGLIVGALQAIEMPFSKIQAKKWQKAMFEGIRPVEVPSMEKKQKGIPAVQKRNKDGSPKYKVDTKATALIAAKRLFPKETFLATQRSKVPHDGIVDSVLIGLYCSRNF